MSAPASSPSLRVVLFGATGAAGSGVLRQCLDNPRVAEVVAVTRRPLNVESSKLTEVICRDFLDLAPLSEHLTGVDACFYCLGVSQTQVPDPARYREITYDYALAAARSLLLHSPAHTFHFLSGSGADPSGRSRILFARVKGETEVALQELGLAGIVCWRPGYIHPLHPREKPHWVGARSAGALSVAAELPGAVHRRRRPGPGDASGRRRRASGGCSGEQGHSRPGCAV